MGAAAYFGGRSSSSTENKTEVRDMRVVGGEGSANVSAADSTVTITATDHGAVSGGLQLAGKAVDSMVKTGEGLNKTTLSLFDGALGAVRAASSEATQAVAAAHKNVAADLATAFTDSKAPEKNILIVGGVAVVGLAAVLMLARRA